MEFTNAAPTSSTKPQTRCKEIKCPVIHDFADFQSFYQSSMADVDGFWADLCRRLLTFEKDFTTVREGTLAEGNLKWFLDGRLNAAYNCVDRHAEADPDRLAIIFEADEPDTSRSITYGDLQQRVLSTALALQKLGVKKGDRVAIYMPMIPEAMITVLAINRLGAIHSIVFDGFSAHALGDRILDAGARVIVTADHGRRAGVPIAMKQTVDQALVRCPEVHSVLVYQHSKIPVAWTEGRDIWWHDMMEANPGFVPAEPMDSEDPLFILYTSGSTGKPKGLVHSTAGFLTGAAATGHYAFGIKPDDVFFCAADIGWITGLVYSLYAPLLLGCTTVVFEGSPVYPNPSRFWDICDKHHVTHFYAAPTVLRLLKKFNGEMINQQMSALRVLGSIGEPIAPEVWQWYHRVVGKGKADVLDTYFQTETGSLVLTPLARVTPTKPGSCTRPFPGIDPVILNPTTGSPVTGPCPEGVLAFQQAWPSMARTAWGDHQRFLETYLKPYPGYYFTGDGARQDADGYFWIKGRVDDVVNVSGHRISTAEIEGVILEHENMVETAVVAVDDPITGQALVAFAVLKTSPHERDVKKDLRKLVSREIGSFSVPKEIHVVEEIPKTRSGKITRRILRKILSNDMDGIGDTSTVANPGAIKLVAASVHGMVH